MKREYDGKTCRDKPCFLQFPGCTSWNTHACHSNRLAHGKGVGLKSERFLPACPSCHDLYDGRRPSPFTREEKQLIWDHGYALWESINGLDKLKQEE